MFQKIIATVLLFTFAVMECGCYSLRNYAPQDVKPDWDIAYVVKKDSTVVRFDDEDQGSIDGKMVIGGVRNDFSEVHPRRIPLDSVIILRVRRLDTSPRMLIVAGVGAGIAAFFIIMLAGKHKSKAPNGQQGTGYFPAP